MKKYLVTGLLCALAVAAAGCGDKGDSGEAGGLVKEPIGEASVNDAKSGEDKSGGSESSGAQEEAKSSDEKSEQAGDTKDEQAGAEGSLYEAFKSGTAKAKYTGSGDRTSYLDTSKVLEKGKSYTMEEIGKALENVDEYMDLKLSGDVQYSMIDCGSDGVEEILVQAPFGDEYSLYMIIKEIDGELVICFDQDSWSRSMVEVKSDGRIEGSGSGGASVSISDYAYVDGKGDYNFYYGVEETLTLYDDFYAYKKGEDYVIIPSEGLDMDHIGIWDYYFEADYTQRTHYYSYFVIDSNYNDITTDADYDDSNELKKRFTDAGIKTYTKSEMEQMLKDRASKIGYPAG